MSHMIPIYLGQLLTHRKNSLNVIVAIVISFLKDLFILRVIDTPQKKSRDREKPPSSLRQDVFFWGFLY